jgi:hypothetical protein
MLVKIHNLRLEDMGYLLMAVGQSCPGRALARVSTAARNLRDLQLTSLTLAA